MASCAVLLILTYIFSHCSLSTLGIVVCVWSTHTNIVSISEITYVMTIAASGDETQSDLVKFLGQWPKVIIWFGKLFATSNSQALILQWKDQVDRSKNPAIAPSHALSHPMPPPIWEGIKICPKGWASLLFYLIDSLYWLQRRRKNMSVGRLRFPLRGNVPSRTPALAWLIGWPY